MNTKTGWRVVLIALWIAAARAAVSFAQEQPIPAAPVREITQLRGDLYEAREGGQYTVFLVTPDGIILVDPLNAPFALWLKDQLASRFPGRAVRYVVFSHHHFDRAEGGGAFLGAQTIGQNAYGQALSNARRSVPSFLGVQDRNENGQLDPNELEGPNVALLQSKDRNHDGTVTPDELYRQVPSARITYGDRRTITLGGKQVELVHSGAWHSPDMTVLFFPEERIVFAVDPPPVTAVPFSFGASRAGDAYDWLHALAPLDFDTLLLGDGRTITRTELRALTGYLDALRGGVASGYDRGRSIEKIQATALPAEYRGTPQYAGRLPQIAAVYRTVRLRQFVLSGVGLANYGLRDPGFCASFAFCSAGGIVPAGTAGASILLSRRVGVAGEVTLSQQSWSTRRQPLFDEEVALRQTRVSGLLRVNPVRGLALLAGPSFTYGDARGINVVRGRLVPTGGRHDIHTHDGRPGVTVGFELRLPFGGAVGLIAPIRVTYTPSSPLPAYWPSHYDATAGVGISVRLARSVH
jgi:glyoxylase-like metal-dependent hydrolase (beta-lactamase superfamily II)